MIAALDILLCSGTAFLLLAGEHISRRIRARRTTRNQHLENQ